MYNVTQARLIEEWSINILDLYEEATGQAISLPIPIFDIAKRLLGIRCDIELFNDKYKNISGILVPRKQWIILNKQQSPQRLAFTLAHEIAHWWIEVLTINGHVDEVLFLPSRLRSDDENTKERKANYFAGALLIPEHMLIDQVVGLHNIDNDQIKNLATLFNVSYRAMEIRLKQLQNSLSKLGIVLNPTTSSFNCRLSAKSYTNSLSAKNSKYAVVTINSTIIDHNLYRILLDLKAKCQNLFLVRTEENKEMADALVDLPFIEGLVIVSETMDQNINDCFTNHVKDDVKFCSIENGQWVKRILSKTNNHIDEAPLMLLRTVDSQLQKQFAFLDISEVVSSPVELNYREKTKSYIKKSKEAGKRVVIVTGCFDMITSAHVKFLKRAKDAGDVLVVGIEDDNRVEAFKGSLRPVNTISQRVEVVDAFEFVDFTFIIKGSPKEDIKTFYTRLHKELRADILAVSEGDPHLDDRKDEIEAGGGELLVVSRYEEGSTTSLIRNLLASTEYSDLIIASKRELKRHSKNNQTNWRQLKLFD